MQGKTWCYILRYQEGHPDHREEYRKLQEMEKNYQENGTETGKEWHNYVTDIDYNRYKVNLTEYEESREHICKKGRDTIWNTSTAGIIGQ